MSCNFQYHLEGLKRFRRYDLSEYKRLITDYKIRQDRAHEESEDDSFEGEDGSDDNEESPSESGSYSVDEQPGVAVDEVSSNDEEKSEADDSEDDDNGDEVNSGDERHPSIEEVLSGSYEEESMPTPRQRAVVDEPRRGSPLEMLLSSARSAANRVIEGFNASPSALLRQNLNQRFEDIDQNRRRSTRERKKIKVFDPSSSKG